MAERTSPKSRTPGAGDPVGSNPAVSPIDLGTDSEFDIRPNGAVKSEVGTSEPQRKSENIAGFTTANPADFDIIDRTDIGTGSGSTGTRKRGRPFGSRNKTPQTANTLIPDLEALLLSVHFMLSRIVDVEELEIEVSEAKQLSDALKDVGKHYAITLDPKKLAIAQLCFTAGGIYGPRAVAIVKNRQNRGPKPVKPVTAPPTHQGAAPRSSVTPIRPPTSTTGMTPHELFNEAPQEFFGD